MRVGSPRRQSIPYYVGSASVGATSAAPKTICPNGVKAGHILIALIKWAGVQTLDTVPAGWTLLLNSVFNSSGNTMASYWRIHGENPQIDTTWALSASVAWETHVHAFQHINTENPVSTTPTETENVSSATYTVPAITTTEKCIIVGLYGGSGTRYIQQHHPLLNRTPLAGSTIMVYTREPRPAGVNGTYACTLPSSATHASQAIALRVAM